MKKHFVRLIAVVLTCVLMLGALADTAAAAPKEKIGGSSTIAFDNTAEQPAVKKREQPKRSIAIVFDNSGSMYQKENTAWAHATYAMEVFARMLNKDDTLSIYPMHRIEIGVDGKAYDWETPLVISGPEQASPIREIYSPDPKGTPIDTIKDAHDGLLKEDGERWLIILTDGGTFDQGRGKESVSLGDKTASTLQKDYLEPYSKDMNVLYLGIGKGAAKPKCSPQSASYKLEVKKVEDAAQILSELTAMCNMIFGRDTLPASHFKKDKMNIDVSLSKMIVFVQGKGVSNVSVTDPDGNKLEPVKGGQCDMKYPVNGAGGKYEGKCKTDENLQGVMLTFENCKGSEGEYTLKYSGEASNAEVYYEPDVDMVFTFTDENGNEVKPDELYEGDYVISYGMMDARTGKYTDSDLLGDVKYSGHYYVNGEAHEISGTEKQGSVKVHLNNGDEFSADMDVVILDKYEIHRGAEDLFPPGGKLKVSPKPAGELVLKISGGQDVYALTTLEQGKPFIAEVFYQGNKLSGEDLEKTEITWDPEQSGAELLKDPKGDYYEIVLRHKDPDHPEATPTGEFSFPMHAIFTPDEATNTAYSDPVQFKYSITDARPPLEVVLTASQTYYVLSKMEEGEPIRAEFFSEGVKLTPEEFNALQIEWNTSGLDYEMEPLPNESACQIRLKASDKLEEGSYKISCSAKKTDEIGRETKADSNEVEISLNKFSALTKILFFSSIGLLLLLLLLAILHIKVLPKKLNAKKQQCSMSYNDEDVTEFTTFTARVDKKRLRVYASYGGNDYGLQMTVKPGKGSFVRTPHAKRSMEVMSASVVGYSSGDVTEAMLGAVKYGMDDETGNFGRIPPNDKPFPLKHGSRIVFSGIDGGAEFNASIQLNCKKGRK